MADPVTKTFDQIVQGQAAAAQSRGSGLVDLTLGSILRAALDAVAGVVLWLQGLILVLLATTRLATSPTDADADTFVADFGAAPLPGDDTLFQRLGAMAATGHVTFARFSTTATALIPTDPAASVSSADGSQVYAVTVDTTIPAYNAGLGGYLLAIGIASLTVPVLAKAPGAAGNAVAGAVNTITSAIVGVDTVTNAAGFTNGADAETTPQMLARWRQFIGALREGTPLALQFRAGSVQRGLTVSVKENTHFDGTPEKGFTTLIVDDGTGAPSSDLLTACGVAVDLGHAAGTSFAVYAPVVVNIDVTAALVTVAGADHAAAVADALAALKAYLNTLPVGATVYWSRVWQTLQDASADLLEVTALTVNTGTADIAIAFNQVAKARTLTIS